MPQSEASLLFDSLTEKQHEALRLAAAHLTSKQIALSLGVAPVTIDKRIDTVRARLGHIPRSDLARLYAHWSENQQHDRTYDPIIGDPIILGDGPQVLSSQLSQPRDNQLAFEDSIILDARASWERGSPWVRPGLKPSDLGVIGKLCVMLGGSVAILMIAVLAMACVNAIIALLNG